jgi:hypothetical protein
MLYYSRQISAHVSGLTSITAHQHNQLIRQVCQFLPAWPYGPYFHSVDISTTLYQRLTDAIDLPADVPALKQYLNAPLREDQKIPMRDKYINSFVVRRGNANTLCSRDHLLQLFRPSELEEADGLASLVKTAMSSTTPHPQSTKNAYISLWDVHMAYIIEHLITEGYSIRNSNQRTYTATLRPDYGYLFRGICTFRGEENQLVFSGEHPRDELINKLEGWYYQPAPYVFGESFHIAPPSVQ